jgi:hypothetical protein
LLQEDTAILVLAAIAEKTTAAVLYQQHFFAIAARNHIFKIQLIANEILNPPRRYPLHKRGT